MPKSVTLAVRVPQEIRQQLEEKVALGAFSSLTALLRDVLTEFALDSSLRESKHGEACKRDANTLGHDKTCPVLAFARNELCTHCPFKEPFQPVTSRVEGIDELLGNLRSADKTT
jgi:Arc/MetJ-type ribon-helix-helix transcriptional regulator